MFADLKGNKSTELLMGGNLYNVKPEVGRYDASYGLTLTIAGDSISTTEPSTSGFQVEGQVRSMACLERRGMNSLIVVARNDDTPKLFELASGSCTES
ncbi:MAG: hypothetical protein U5K69_23695 [Balneolaceae bacterium]|nr:hypothetical protein [Balneolaceae bacterium]